MHLAHRTYRPRPPSRILCNGKPTQGTVSPVHVVFAHGLFGNNHNFTSVCTSLAGLDGDARLATEAKLRPSTHTYIPGSSAQAAPPVPLAAEPRVYTCSAFDWRNHGDSPHTPNMNLIGLSEDLRSYLEAYAAHLRYEPLRETRSSKGIACVPVEGGLAQVMAGAPPGTAPAASTISSASSDVSRGSPDVAGHADGAPLPVLLVAHSMGAMAMMDWLWREHVNIWAHNIFLEGDSPLREENVFVNKHYRIIGAVVIDMTPAQRPQSFNDTIQMINYLPEVPLHQFRTAQEVEKWLLANGPQEVFNRHNLFHIRYYLSNIDFTVPGSPRWRIGLQEIIGGLHEILWEEGGVACIQQARDALLCVNRKRIAQHKKIWERPAKFSAFPTYFIFGEHSPYNSATAHAAVLNHFLRPHLVQLNDADHFLFMRHKVGFMDQLRAFCYDAEVKAGVVPAPAPPIAPSAADGRG